MTTDQILLFGLFVIVFILLIWGRWRYDMVAFAALVVALILGLVPTEQAFSGFGHPATVIIALVLVVSRGLLNSGAGVENDARVKIQWINSEELKTDDALEEQLGGAGGDGRGHEHRQRPA